MAVPGKGSTTKLFGEKGGKNILNQLNKPKVIVMTNHVQCTFMIWVRCTLFVYLVACAWALVIGYFQVKMKSYLSNRKSTCPI